ncbi:hypothetical protein RRG08_043974 [Elysia crispata]|uniref:Uncharacterized protein n=1 Tax=Elysia crispata TaxID=231223 RepID=A0AAE1DP66_9GAST|nr:hypothetical protein RRG08_043974 [Elysia crispata]
MRKYENVRERALSTDNPPPLLSLTDTVTAISLMHATLAWCKHPFRQVGARASHSPRRVEIEEPRAISCLLSSERGSRKGIRGYMALSLTHALTSPDRKAFSSPKSGVECDNSGLKH